MRSENTVELLTAIVVGSSVTATIYYVRLGGDIDNVRRQKCEENVQCATADAVPAWLLTAVALTSQSLVQLALMGYGYRSYLDFGWRIFKVRVRVRAPNPNPDPNPSPKPNLTPYLTLTLTSSSSSAPTCACAWCTRPFCGSRLGAGLGLGLGLGLRARARARVRVRVRVTLLIGCAVKPPRRARVSHSAPNLISLATSRASWFSALRGQG